AARRGPETRGDLGHPRPGGVRGRQRTPVLVGLRVQLVREREEPEDLVERLRLNADALVERQPERVEQRVERIPPFRGHLARSAGKRITSRIASLPGTTILK